MSARVNFKKRLLMNYPVPEDATIWCGNGERPALEDLDFLIDASVEELSSDIHIKASKRCSGLKSYFTKRDGQVVDILSCQLVYNFQGNKWVKWNYNDQERSICLKYYPCQVNYLRKFMIEDLGCVVTGTDDEPVYSWTGDMHPKITGDILKYVVLYIQAQMAEKELFYLKSVTVNVDNGSLDYGPLEAFLAKAKEVLASMKQDIFIYTATY